MIALSILTALLYRPHPLLGFFTRRFVGPMLIGFWLGEFVTWLGEPYLIAFVILANVLAALLVYLIVFRKR